MGGDVSVSRWPRKRTGSLLAAKPRTHHRFRGKNFLVARLLIRQAELLAGTLLVPDGLAEDLVLRGLHPMIAERVELTRPRYLLCGLMGLGRMFWDRRPRRRLPVQRVLPR